MKINCVLFLFTLFSCFYGTSQMLTVKNQHVRNYLFSDSLDFTNKTHNNVKPLIIKTLPLASTLISIPIKKRGLIYPITDLGIGIDNRTGGLFDLGIGAGIDFGWKKFTISGKVLPYATASHFIRDSIQSISNIDISVSRKQFGNMFFQGELVAAFKPNKFFTFLGGIGKNSFGNGYRSLLLSDHAASNPFLKMETSFWGIKYVNLFNVWNDFFNEPSDQTKDITKLSAIHYLSWNINKRINLSVFESVIWQAKDSLTNRFFEPNYMNPFVLYRPVEYAQGSADNVLLGMDLSYKPNKNSVWYLQLVLDEFYLKEIRARNQWWANKFGTQFGVKSMHFIIPNFFAQLEFNMVRPFTYSHKQSPQSYGHANSSVTHPLGANFYEINSMLSYQYKKHQFTAHFFYSMYGSDSSDISYGQNIFESYSDRLGNYNHKIGQGEKHNVFITSLYYEYPIKHIPNLFLTARYRIRLATKEQYFDQNHSFEIGIRSRIWNRYDNL
ncbi:MAG: hypothetical protein AB8B74_12660 [Crocinitomicaceae bacterium]